MSQLWVQQASRLLDAALPFPEKARKEAPPPSSKIPSSQPFHRGGCTAASQSASQLGRGSGPEQGTAADWDAAEYTGHTDVEQYPVFSD